jgi:hypothetical protein
MSRWNHKNQGFKKGHPHYNKKGYKINDTSKMKGHSHPAWNKGIKTSLAQIEKLRLAKIGKVGSMSNNWKGGVSTNNHSLTEPKYKEWRNLVFKRDSYKCKISNQECCSYIEPHHILPWRDFPELRYEINNGITLCRVHHPRKRTEEKRLAPTFQELVSVSN